jgi:hypothetical protein
VREVLFSVRDCSEPDCRTIASNRNNRNLNVARELEVVASYAARCRELTQYSSSLPRGVSLG